MKPATVPRALPRRATQRKRLGALDHVARATLDVDQAELLRTRRQVPRVRSAHLHARLARLVHGEDRDCRNRGKALEVLADLCDAVGDAGGRVVVAVGEDSTDGGESRRGFGCWADQNRLRWIESVGVVDFVDARVHHAGHRHGNQKHD